MSNPKMPVLTDRLVLESDWEGNHNGKKEEERDQHQQHHEKGEAEFVLNFLDDDRMESERHTLPEEPLLESRGALPWATLNWIVVSAFEVVSYVHRLQAFDEDEREGLWSSYAQSLVLSNIQMLIDSDSLSQGSQIFVSELVVPKKKNFEIAWDNWKHWSETRASQLIASEIKVLDTLLRGGKAFQNWRDLLVW